MTTEYPTLTALMAGREPGSVKVRLPGWKSSEWGRPGRQRDDGTWKGLDEEGHFTDLSDEGPWLLVSEDAPALDTLRLEIAARVLAGLDRTRTPDWVTRHAYALAEADALIKEARK